MIEALNTLDHIEHWLPDLLLLVAGVFIGRRKKKAEVTSIELDNVAKSIEIYRQLTADLEADIRNLREQIDLLKEQNDQLLQKLDDEISEKKQLKAKLEALERKLNEIQNFNNA